MNSILKSAAKYMVELSQLSGKNDAKQAEMQHTKGEIGKGFKEEMEKQSSAWTVHKEYG